MLGFKACVLIFVLASNLQVYKYNHLAPTGAPHNVVTSTTSRSVTVFWDAIECLERNGQITDYTVVFQQQGGAEVPGEVNVRERSFTASGLTPHTNYTFRVAGVNSNGTGPLSDILTILTSEDSMFIIR